MLKSQGLSLSCLLKKIAICKENQSHLKVDINHFDNFYYSFEIC